MKKFFGVVLGAGTMAVGSGIIVGFVAYVHDPEQKYTVWQHLGYSIEMMTWLMSGLVIFVVGVLRIPKL